ncbi:hypothetical protein [Rugosimonospora africana]|uniref:Uncharacterized protein n=1 Tax=Rugosimonospora africana TaxID=556532 RepID=A0A8J3VMQ4_9ACTN|nr:hypothetical protein [Rugosimonospora africana]GIH12474.1 hypothetical protein Raf01_06460 [Rugosimonospora africana]
MPTVSELARVTTRDGAVWRACVCCGLLAPLAPDVDRCDGCATPTGQASRGGMATVRLITSLLRDIPPAGATVLERAEWFDRKADVFDRITSEDVALSEEAARLAEGARAEADRLRREAAA